MTTRRKTLIVKTTFWLATEIILNLVGLDNLADYSEFVFDRDCVTAVQSSSIVTGCSSNT